MEISEKFRIATCRISVAFVKEKPSHDSLLVTQVLFGEQVLILRKKNRSWYKIRCLWDGVEGWIDPKQFWIEEKSEAAPDACFVFSLEHFYGLNGDRHTIPIMLGSNLFSSDGINVRLPAGKFKYSGQIVDLRQTISAEKLLLKIARRYIHSPFISGGRCITGTDSSGFIQVVFKMLGIGLPRWPVQMASMGEDVGFFVEASPGDLAFFGPDLKTIDHMGLVMEDGMILHADGRVKLDRFDQQGIYDLELKRYVHKLRTIRRIAFGENVLSEEEQTANSMKTEANEG